MLRPVKIRASLSSKLRTKLPKTNMAIQRTVKLRANSAFRAKMSVTKKAFKAKLSRLYEIIVYIYLWALRDFYINCNHCF